MGLSLSVKGKRITQSMINELIDYLEELSRSDVIKVVRKTIGYPGRGDCDYSFVSVNNSNEQVINLGYIIPARARVVDICVITNEQWTSAVSFGTEVGSASSGAQYIVSSDIYTTNTISAIAAGGAFATQPLAIASEVYISSTPGANWDVITGGKMTVYITYLDVVI